MRRFLKSFGFAAEGIASFFRQEKNGRIQGIIALLMIVAGFLAHLRRREWMALLFCIAAVISLEMINSAIEKLCNILSPDYHPGIKTIKDVAAGAVLWTSLLAAIIGILIFFPHLRRLF